MVLVRDLSDAQIRDFFDVGFVLVHELFSTFEVARMRAAFARLEATARALREPGMVRGSQFVVDRREDDATPARIHRVVWCGAAEPVLSEYGHDPRLVRIAAQLLGSSTMSQLINQAHFKFPGDGVEFPWHQDSKHRRYGTDEWRDVNGKGSYVQSAMALDAVTPESGPIEFIASRMGHLDIPADGTLPKSVDASRAVAPLPRPGDVIFFGPYTIHRSLPNRSERPRRTFINGFAYPGANSRVYPGEGAGRTCELRDDDAPRAAAV